METLVGIVIGGAIAFVGGYFGRKGENVATKEDIAAIEQSIQEVRSSHTTELDLLTRKREVYQRIAEAMRVFLKSDWPEGELEQRQSEFLRAYDSAFLWASEEVFTALSEFLSLNQQHTKTSAQVPEGPQRTRLLVELDQSQKDLYQTCMLAMRRDAGFRDTPLRPDDYQVVSFGPPLAMRVSAPVDPRALALNQSVTFGDPSLLRATVTKVAPDLLSLVYVDPQSEQVVFKATLTIGSGQANIEALDESFWTITLDGEPAELSGLQGRNLSFKLDYPGRQVIATSRAVTDRVTNPTDAD